MGKNFELIINLAIGIIVVWYSAKFFIRANGLKSYMFWKHYQDFASLYKLTFKNYPADVNIKAKLYLIGIPLSIIILFVLFFSFTGSNL